MSIPKSLKILLKVILWTLATFITLISLFFAVVVWTLSPSQLTPICEDYANEYFDAKVSIGKTELTIWKTLPYATVDIDDLDIVSNGFKSLTAEQKATLPANADTLISTKRIHIGINLFKIPLGTFELKDIMIDAPVINAVAFNDSVANYNIMPPDDGEPIVIPDMSINSFEIINCKGIQYYNAASNTSAKIGITAAQLKETTDGNYQILFNGNTSASVGTEIIVPDFPLDINGLIDWSSKSPLIVALKKWEVSANNIPIKFDVAMDMQKDFIVNSLNVKVDSITLASVIPFIPKAYSKFTDEINTNANGAVKLSLLRPYNLSGTAMPYVNLDVLIPESYLKFKNGKGIDKLIVDMNVNVNGENLDSTVVTLNKFYMLGKSLDFNIDGKVNNMISNAHIKGRFKGHADINKIIKALKIPLDFSVSGILDANATLDARMKQMNANSFHQMKIHGDVNLHNFNFFRYKDSMTVYSREMNFNFGTGDNISTNGVKMNEISHAMLKTDTLSLHSKGLNVTLKNGEISGGFKGHLSLELDTTKLVPIGAKIKAERVNIIDIDSTVIRLRNFECSADISRMANSPRKPRIDLDIKANRLSYADSVTRMSMKNAEIKMTAMHRIRRNTRINAAADSIGQIYNGLSRDSVMAISRKERRSRTPQSKINDENSISLKADSGIQRLLNQWQLSGFFKAERGRAFTPYFPLRNTVSNIEIDFSTDSIIIKNIDYKTGHSMFSMNGGVRNIRSTLLGRNRKPLSIIFNLESDTLNINELIKAAFAGSHYKDNVGARYNLGTNDTEEHIEMLATNAHNNSDSILTAITIPQNIDAEINIMARNGIYADMFMKRAKGSILVHDGQLQLSNIRANTDRGSMALSALYSAPTKKNIKFAFDLSMTNIDVHRFLDIIPQVDSILPLLKTMGGIIQADIATAADVDSTMNVLMPSLKAAIKLHGDSLILFDSETFSTIAKMLRFKNKERNLIDNMAVEILIQDSQLELFPFTFDMDRYRFGIMGHNDMNLNLNYHVSVLKSPIPFKFGVNITGNADNPKYRIGGARFKEDHVAQLSKIVDTTRINLRDEMNNLFRRGAKAGLSSTLRFNGAGRTKRLLNGSDSLTRADSLQLIKEGLIEAPVVRELSPKEQKAQEKERKKAEKERKKEEKKNKKLRKKDTAWVDPRQKQK